MKKIKLKSIYMCPNCLTSFYGALTKCPICKKDVVKLKQNDSLINVVKKGK